MSQADNEKAPKSVPHPLPNHVYKKDFINLFLLWSNRLLQKKKKKILSKTFFYYFELLLVGIDFAVLCICIS